jgi:UDP-glucose:(heptosyl)LPS alpha-1,3-glucosyltransferase
LKHKHIAFIKSGVRHRGGLEKSASRIINGFAESGARVSVLTTGPVEPSSHPQISFHSIHPSSWPPFIRMEQFDRFVERWLLSHPVDLIFGMDRIRKQTHLRAGNGVHGAYLESRRLSEGALKYYSCLLNPMHRKILQLEREAFEYEGLKTLFTNSHMVQRQILERFSIAPQKVKVLHNGVEWADMEGDFSRWQESKEAMATSLRLDPETFHFLFIGNGYHRKGLHILLEGLSRLRGVPYVLSVIGKEKQMEKFQAQVKLLGLEKQVIFWGPRTDIRTFYQLADVLCIPSFYDPFANVTVEALAMGLYVVSSKQNGGSEILTSSSGALIEDLLDPDSVTAALTEALKHRKTAKSAAWNRKSVESLDFSKQIPALIEACDG